MKNKVAYQKIYSLVSLVSSYIYFECVKSRGFRRSIFLVGHVDQIHKYYRVISSTSVLISYVLE